MTCFVNLYHEQLQMLCMDIAGGLIIEDNFLLNSLTKEHYLIVGSNLSH